MGRIVDDIDVNITLDYAAISNFPVSTAPGHAGRLIFETLDSVDAFCKFVRTIVTFI